MLLFLTQKSKLVEVCKLENNDCLSFAIDIGFGTKSCFDLDRRLVHLAGWSEEMRMNIETNNRLSDQYSALLGSIIVIAR